MEDLERVVKRLSSIRVRVGDPPERHLHDLVAASLSEGEFAFEREVRFGRRGRPDFVVCEHIVVEVKKGRPGVAPTLVQLNRYASEPSVTAVVLVAERGIPDLPEMIGKVPLRQVALNAAWGIAV